MAENKRTHCELCGRAARAATKHHLIPRTCHTNKWFQKNFTRLEMGKRTIWVCRDCHRAIHAAVPSEKELGRHWNTRELLLGHPQIVKHVEWARRQKRTVV